MKIETYGFSVDDFWKYKIGTTTPESYNCPKCKQQAGQPCVKPPQSYLYHQERIQAKWDKMKSVAEFVKDTKITTSRIIEL